MKTARMFQVNGAWYASSQYGARLLAKSGLKGRGFLSLKLVEDHLKKHGIKIEEVKHGK